MERRAIFNMRYQFESIGYIVTKIGDKSIGNY
jgi:hypothetical protein